jgi:hypothetical protein
MVGDSDNGGPPNKSPPTGAAAESSDFAQVLKGAFGRIDSLLQQRVNALAAGSSPQLKETDEINSERSLLGPVPEEPFMAVKQCLAENRIEDALRLADRLNLSRVLNVPARRFHDFTAQDKLIYAEARHVAVTTPQAVVSLARAAEYVLKNDVPGAFVECGVYLGGSIIVMLRTLLLNGITDRDVYLFDTFEGMPQPGEQDVYYTGEPAAATWRFFSGTEQGSNWVRADLESVKARVLAVGYPTERIHFVKGMVEETVPARAPKKIALLRLDTDFYSSTKHELEHLYPRLSRGGVLIIDDYGAFRGSREATDEYIARSRVPLLLSRVDEHVRMAVKLDVTSGKTRQARSPVKRKVRRLAHRG